MKPVVSVAQMNDLDAAALEDVGYEALVAAAGYSVAHHAIRLLGGCSGARVVVLAGSGSNGADGRIAARHLAQRGAKVTIVGPDADEAALERADLVIDAAFGTGLNRDYVAPEVPQGTLVLAVDLPSGLDGETGTLRGRPLKADLTVTMGAIKSGLLLGNGPEYAGEVVLADIGIDVAGAAQGLLEDDDLKVLTPRSARAHKWSAAVVLVAGSPGMEGAAALAALGALKAGAGMVRLLTTGSLERLPLEVVTQSVATSDLADRVLHESAKASALVIGPGLGTDPQLQHAVRTIVEQRHVPTVIDADGLGALGGVDELTRLVAARPVPVVCTPHDGELVRLLGRLVGDDRLERVMEVVEATGATMLSKGSTTLVVGPEGNQPLIRYVTAGTPALATAGTGDVLAGMIGAFLAQGVDAVTAASVAAQLHGRAGARASGTLVAAELPLLVGELLEEVMHRGG